MLRREFLRLTAVASLAPRPAIAADGEAPATLLYDDHAITLDNVRTDPATGTIWVRTRDLPRVNEFEVKPQGACRADVCIPITRSMRRGSYFNLTEFANRIAEPVVAEPGERVWSLGEIQIVRGAYLQSRLVPDFAVPDRAGRPVHLSAFRGRKVLVLTWASW